MSSGSGRASPLAAGWRRTGFGPKRREPAEPGA